MARPLRISEKFGWASEPIWEAWVVVKLRYIRRTTMIDKVVKSADVGSVDLPFPGYTGDIKIKPLNGD